MSARRIPEDERSEHALDDADHEREDDGSRRWATALVGAIESDRRIDARLVRARARERMFGGASRETERVGRFELEAVLGRGGMGVVYAALDPWLRRRIALKLVQARPGSGGARMLARVTREARAAAAVEHPNVITIYDVGTWTHAERPSVYVAMELIEGTTLRQWTHGRRPAAIVRAFVAAGRGLAAAHARGVIHADFKPDNVLVSRSGDVKVADFGLAHALTDAAETTGSSGDRAADATDSALHVGGTVGYMPLEQIEGAPLDPRADQFAFCVSLCECLGGSRPFAGRTVAESAAAIRTTRPPRLNIAGVSRRVARAIARGLAVAREDRFPDLDALLDELEPRRGRWLAAGFLGAAAMTLVNAMPSHCDESAPLIADVWNPEEAARLLTRDGADPAQGARAVAAVDEWVARWNDTQRMVCEANTRGQIPAEILELRSRCLRRRAVALRSWLRPSAREVASDEPDFFAEAPRLPPIEQCAHVVRGAPISTADDPRFGEETNEVERALTRAFSDLYYERLPEGRRAAAEALRLARELGDERLIAEARYMVASVEGVGASGQERTLALLDLYDRAIELGEDELAGRVAASLAEAASDAAQLDEVEHWARLGEAAFERAGADPGFMRPQLQAQEALALASRGRIDEALALHDRALAAIEGHERDKARAAFNVISFKATTLQHAGRHAEAAALLQRALDIAEENLLGERTIAVALASLAGIHYDEGRADLARADAEEALASFEASVGPQSADAAMMISNLGLIASSLGDVVGARARFEDAHERWDAIAPGGTQAATAWADSGGCLARLGERDQGLARVEEALVTIEARLGPDAIDVAWVLDIRTEILLALGRSRAAERDALRSLAIREHYFGPEHPDMVIAMRTLARITAAEGRPLDAIRYFDRALALVRRKASVDDRDAAQLEAERAAVLQALGLAGRG